MLAVAMVGCAEDRSCGVLWSCSGWLDWLLPARGERCCGVDGGGKSTVDTIGTVALHRGKRAGP
eukprot:4002953-Amphidinium_carterae.5